MYTSRAAPRVGGLSDGRDGGWLPPLEVTGVETAAAPLTDTRGVDTRPPLLPPGAAGAAVAAAEASNDARGLLSGTGFSEPPALYCGLVRSPGLLARDETGTESSGFVGGAKNAAAAAAEASPKEPRGVLTRSDADARSVASRSSATFRPCNARCSCASSACIRPPATPGLRAEPAEPKPDTRAAGAAAVRASAAACSAALALRCSAASCSSAWGGDKQRNDA